MNTTLKNTKPFIAALAMACLAGIAVTAHANDTAVAATRTVGYGDLDLNTRTGAAALYKRIRVAAERVCGDVDSRQLDQAAAAQACVERAIDSSVHAVNNMNLTSESQIHGGAAPRQLTVASAK